MSFRAQKRKCMTKFICVFCDRNLSVGRWYQEKWVCIWCNDKAPKEPSPDIDYRPVDRNQRNEVSIEEIPCDNVL